MKPHPETDVGDAERYQEEVFRALGVSNWKDAASAANGLRERVIFTRDFESLRYRLEAVGDVERRASELLAEMRRCSALVDDAPEAVDYQVRLCALGLIARQYIRLQSPALGDVEPPLSGTPEGLCTRCSATQYCAEHEPPAVGDVERRASEPLKMAINSAQQLLLHCAERDVETEHEQEWNFLHGHAATVAAYFERFAAIGDVEREPRD